VEWGRGGQRHGLRAGGGGGEEATSVRSSREDSREARLRRRGDASSPALNTYNRAIRTHRAARSAQRGRSDCTPPARLNVRRKRVGSQGPFFVAPCA
jgi:hypothetical protein